jgi:hypothetical protein
MRHLSGSCPALSVLEAGPALDWEIRQMRTLFLIVVTSIVGWSFTAFVTQLLTHSGATAT